MKLFNSNEFCSSEIFKNHILCKKKKKKMHNVGDFVYVGYTCEINKEDLRFVAPIEIKEIEVIDKDVIKYKGKFISNKQSNSIKACNSSDFEKEYSFDDSNMF